MFLRAVPRLFKHYLSKSLANLELIAHLVKTPCQDSQNALLTH